MSEPTPLARPEAASASSTRGPERPSVDEPAAALVDFAELDRMAGKVPTPPGSRFFETTEEFIDHLRSRPYAPDADHRS